MERSYLFSVSSVAFVSSLLAFSSPAIAQGQPEKEKASGLDVIVVTAQKFSENLQQVPIAITAFSGETLENQRIEGVQDIAIRTPGFVIGQRNPADPDLTIRGIGSNEPHAGSDRSVIVSVDDVAISRGGGSVFELFDLERIEVLRGPQGTLNGRNAVGGAINIITRRPSLDDIDAKAQLTVGERNLIEGKAYVTGPISDTVAAKLVFSGKSQEGYNTSTITGDSLGDTNSFNLRSQFLFKPSENFEFLLSGEASRDTIDGIAVKLAPAGALFTDTPINFTPSPNPFLLEDDFPGFFERDLYGVSGRAIWTAGAVDITSITAYRTYDLRNQQNLTGAPLNSDFDPVTMEPTGFRSVEDANEENAQFSQELRISSNNDSRLRWVAGLYYFNESTDRLVNFERSILTSDSMPQANQRVDTDSYAIYGQATFELTDRLNVTLGGRYTYDKKSLALTVIDRSSGTSDTLAPFIEEYDVSSSTSFDAFTPKVTLDYSVTDDILLYASAAKGYKSGGFLGVAGSGTEAVKEFQPEIAWNYELGAKSRFFNDQLQLNLAVFKTDFSDLQVRQRVLAIPGNQASAVSVVRNAADAKIFGVEAEVLVRPTRDFTIGASYAYLDTEFKNFGTNSGNSLPRSPKHSFTLTGDYTFDIDDDWEGFVRGSYSWRDDFFYDDAETPSGLEKAYGLLDASVGVAVGNWEFSVWGKNLTDKAYRVFVQPVSTNGLSTFGPPRTLGGSITWKFN